MTTVRISYLVQASRLTLHLHSAGIAGADVEAVAPATPQITCNANSRLPINHSICWRKLNTERIGLIQVSYK